MSDACATCDGLCCYNVVVPVTAYDALRIKRAQALDFNQFLSAGEPRQMTGGVFRLGEAPHVLLLGKNAAEPRACTFLMHIPGDVRRCGIYPERPRVCAVYPMTLMNGAVDIRTDVACKPANWNLATLTYPLWRLALLEHFFEGLLNDRAARTWNDVLPAGARTLGRYYAYAERCFERIDEARERLGTEAWVTIVSHWQDAGPSAGGGESFYTFMNEVETICRTEAAAA